MLSRLEISGLQKELRDLKEQHQSLEARAFFIRHRPIDFQAFRNWESLQNEERDLLAYFGKRENGDIVAAFNAKMKGFKSKEAKLKNMLNSIQQRLKLAQKADDQATKSDVCTIRQRFDRFRSEFTKLREYYVGFRMEFCQNITTLRKVIAALIAKNAEGPREKLADVSSQVAKLREAVDGEERRVSERRERLTLTVGDEVSIDYDKGKLESEVRKVVDIINAFKTRIDVYTVNAKPVMSAIDEMERKIADLSERIRVKLVEKAEMESQKAAEKWATLKHKLVQKRRYEELAGKALRDEEELQKRIDHERVIASEVIAGTNMTVLEMRREIVRLSHLVSKETQEGTDELTRLETEHHQLETMSKAEIEALESKITASRA